MRSLVLFEDRGEMGGTRKARRVSGDGMVARGSGNGRGGTGVPAGAAETLADFPFVILIRAFGVRS